MLQGKRRDDAAMLNQRLVFNQGDTRAEQQGNAGVTAYIRGGPKHCEVVAVIREKLRWGRCAVTCLLDC